MRNNTKPIPAYSGTRDSIIVCRTAQGYEVRATPLRITRHVVAFEVYNPYSIIQLSEVLQEFRIVVNERMIYSGRATVSNLVNTGVMLVCEATLDDAWLDVDLFALITEPQKLEEDFLNFFREWEKNNAILADYKVVLSDMQNYFIDLQRWLDQVELGIRSCPAPDHRKIELDVIHRLVPNILPSLNTLFSRFEDVANSVTPELLPIHRTYAKRQLHAHLLCSPFAYRTYHKPLGYAGDYEMVNMILRDPLEGSSLFSKSVNLWFLSQAPAAAHRNRVKYLSELLAQESQRVAGSGRRPRIFDLGCGPAGEIQKFLTHEDVSNQACFTLLDFNDETLTHVGKTLEEYRRRFKRSTQIELVKKSVHQVLKDECKTNGSQRHYDVIYCAGVFDYLSDRICKRLMNIFYDMLEPGGLLVATNVDTSNPSRHGMEYLLEWHLIHRDSRQLTNLAPDRACPSAVRIKAEETGVNIYIEVRKPA
jgi:extracellular factor (EF) 3-hydroxypalmitic acid methyl ester biosynthesis protein